VGPVECSALARLAAICASVDMVFENAPSCASLDRGVRGVGVGTREDIDTEGDVIFHEAVTGAHRDGGAKTAG
jgi:hypothetical protein